MSTSNQKRTGASRNKKGLAMGFASRQRETIDASGQQLNDRLAALQRGQEELEKEREALDALRQELATTSPPSTSQHIALLPLADLRLSGDTQSRVHLDPSIVSEYMERMIVDEQSGQVLDPEGNPWEPIKVYREEEGEETGGTNLLWVADGFHRASAARELGLERFPCIVLEGTQRDAVRESLSANARHGLRRTRADKRRAVERALFDAEWRTWTDQRLADLCAVSRSMVSKTREELERANSIPFEIALYGADGREFEREEPPVLATSQHEAKQAQQSASAPVKKHEKSTGHMAKRVACSWKKAPKDLSKVKANQMVVAYPEVEAHYTTLRDTLHSERTPSALLLPLLDGSEWFWRGPSILHELVEQGVFAQPVVLFIEAFDKHFVCWNRRDLAEPLCGTITNNQLAAHNALILGTSLDAW